MPEKLQLDNSNYVEIFQKAIDKLEMRAPWWEHKEASDPGITLIELWAMLSDMQSYYLDQVQGSHYRKYLKLLGIKQDNGGFASSWVSIGNVEEEQVLPEGTRLLADNMIFETAEEVVLSANRINAFYLGAHTGNASQNMAYQMNMQRKFSFMLKIQDQKDTCLFTLELDNAVEAGGDLRLFILLDEKNGRNRTNSMDFRMAWLVWEYLTEDGWRAAEEVSDDTCGLLYSGQIILRFHGQMSKAVRLGEAGYPVRCAIRKGSYDVMPVIYKILPNVVKVYQKNTLCKTCHLSYGGAQEALIPLRGYLEQTGRIEVYVEKGEGEWEDFAGYYEVSPPITRQHRERQLIFSLIRFGRVPPKGFRNIKIVSSQEHFKDMYEPYGITGVSSQVIPLVWKNLFKDSFEIMLRSKQSSPVFWEYEETEPEEDGVERAWHWAEEEKLIVLGDGRHGEIPHMAEDGLRITSLTLFEGEKGNVAYGKIKQWERKDLFEPLTCKNRIMAKGGRDGKTAKEQFVKVAEQWGITGRAVTAQDYASLAQRTPGLILNKAEAGMAADGSIQIRLYPPKEVKSRYCLERYKEAVREYMEQYRMISSNIIVEVETEG